MPRETLDVQPGYYFAFGETLDELADQLSVVRFYFNCRAGSAPALFGELTSLLNRYQTPFQLKAPIATAAYDRVDAVVLYVGARYFPIVARLVLQLRERVPIEDAVPLFTKRLWPGIGVAMEPGSGEMTRGSSQRRSCRRLVPWPGSLLLEVARSPSAKSLELRAAMSMVRISQRTCSHSKLDLEWMIDEGILAGLLGDDHKVAETLGQRANGYAVPKQMAVNSRAIVTP